MAEEYTTAKTVELMKMQSVLAESVNSYRTEIEVLQKQKAECEKSVILMEKAREDAIARALEKQAKLDIIEDKTKLSTDVLNDTEYLLSSKAKELFALGEELFATQKAVEGAKEAFAKHESDVKRAMDDATRGSEALIAERQQVYLAMEKKLGNLNLTIDTVEKTLEHKQREVTDTSTSLEKLTVELEIKGLQLATVVQAEVDTIERMRLLSESEPVLVAKVAELQSKVDGLSGQLRDFEVTKSGVADLARNLAGKEELLRSLYGDMGLKW